MSVKKLIKSTQEQAVASWINYLNQLRLDYLTEFMINQDKNLDAAVSDIDFTLKDIHHLIDINRGGANGIHGFIAEAAEAGTENARRNMLGNPDKCIWVDDNGPVDLIRGGVDIQQKFYQSGLSLGAVAAHLKKYPNFLKDGGKYQIPKDQYEKIKYLLSVSKEQANKFPTQYGTFSLKQWKAVHEFFEDNKISFDDIEPSILEYKEVQREQIDITLNDEKRNLKEIDKERRDKARLDSMPTLKEGVKVILVSAAIECGTAFGIAVLNKRKEGKYLKSYTGEDWKDILGETGKGASKGGIRGACIYLLTNYTATPAAVANSIMTASFGIAYQAYLLREEKITEEQFIDNSEMLCLDSAVSGLSSFIGQVVIPVPMLGAIIGNTVGITMYKIAKDGLSDREKKIIKKYLESIEKSQEELDQKYKKYIDMLNHDYELYLEILNMLYSLDVKIAFEGSIKLAKSFNIPSDEILDSEEKIHNYFLD